MEQKQLDEINESYFGEEFIDEENIKDKENIIKKTNKVDKSSKKGKAAKVASKKIAKDEDFFKSDFSKSETVRKASVASASSLDDSEIKIIPISDEDIKHEDVKHDSAFDASEHKKVVDPWEDESENSESIFKEASTWKAITGIVVILLIFSVFTNGFNFNGDGVTGASVQELSLADAEKKALDYVNDNLLQPPFVAELTASEELTDLYKVTISVAGQQVDSYLTKDGSLFFPQGFDTSINFDEVKGSSSKGSNQDNSAESEPSSEASVDTSTGSDSPADVEATEQPAPAEVPVEGTTAKGATEQPAEIPAEDAAGLVVEEPVEATAAVSQGQEKSFTLNAKKWLFSPSKLSVSAGDRVVLNFVPENLAFTFSIPELGVEKEISGPIKVEFTADTPGSYKFLCSSCESWRGMTGTLVVE